MRLILPRIIPKQKSISWCRTAPRRGFLLSKSRGGVRCVLCSENRTVRYGDNFNFSKACGAVQWGVSPQRCGVVQIIFFKHRTVRCGAVIRRAVVSYGAVERAP